MSTETGDDTSDKETTTTNFYLHETNLKDVRFEVFAAATMKNVVFWDIKPQFVPPV
jgi:hypothetical protein